MHLASLLHAKDMSAFSGRLLARGGEELIGALGEAAVELELDVLSAALRAA